LQAAADPIRLAILRQLSLVGPVCACNIAGSYDVAQPTVSHHLRVLREAGWIDGERRGTWIWYSIRPEAMARFDAIGQAFSPTAKPGRRLPVVQPATSA
jgi:ArsR family transcriptional regulator